MFSLIGFCILMWLAIYVVLYTPYVLLLISVRVYEAFGKIKKFIHGS